MIRRSTAIATVAILASLLVHSLGLTFVPPVQLEPPETAAATDVVTLGNAFEDLAEVQAEPVQPDPVQAPETPAAPVPEPERAEVPTSDALVASENPQRVFAPDTGSANVVRRSVSGESDGEESSRSVPDTVEPSPGEQGVVADPDTTPPVAPDTVSSLPRGNPEAGLPPIKITPVAPVPSSTGSTPPQAAITAPAPVIAAITPRLETSVEPEIPLLPDDIDPEAADPTDPTTQADAPDVQDDTEVETEEPITAVTTSLRPRLRKPGVSTDLFGAPDEPNDFSDLRFPKQTIESPLTAYLRNGFDAIAQGDGGAQSGGRGTLDSRGPGNSDTTNYAGRVLVHLNRAPIAHVSARGFAQVFFEINPDGTVAWVDIVDSSGSRDVDRAAKEQINKAAPFPRPPGGVSRKLSFFYRID